MSYLKKSHLLCIGIYFITFNLISQSQKYGSISYNKAVNISGKQRMLSQKMSKSFLLLTYGANNEEIKRELTSSKFIFQKQLEIIKENGKHSTVIKLLVKDTEKKWQVFKTLIEAEPNEQNAKKVLNLNTDLLKSCHAIVQQIESMSGYSNKFFNNYDQELVTIINKSGKQRMLSQRLCLYYTACTLFPKHKKEYQKILEATYTEFNDAIGYLLINSYNTTASEEEIGEIMHIWENYSSNKSHFIDTGFDLVDVFKTTNDLTTRFNKVTGIYESVAKSKI